VFINIIDMDFLASRFHLDSFSNFDLLNDRLRFTLEFFSSQICFIHSKDKILNDTMFVDRPTSVYVMILVCVLWCCGMLYVHLTTIGKIFSQ